MTAAVEDKEILRANTSFLFSMLLLHYFTYFNLSSFHNSSTRGYLLLLPHFIDGETETQRG